MKNKFFQFGDLVITAKQCGEEGSKYHADATVSVLERRKNGKFNMIEGDVALAYDQKNLSFEDVSLILFDRVCARMVERKLWSYDTVASAKVQFASVLGYVNVSQNVLTPA